MSAPTVATGGCAATPAMPVEKVAHLAQVAEEQVRVRALELAQRVVAGEHGAAHHAGVARGLDVVDHVADEDGLVGVEAVLGQQVEDDLALVEGLRVGLPEVGLDAEALALGLVVLVMDRAEKKRGQAALAQVVEELLRVGQQGDAGLQELERGVVVMVELGQRQLGQVLFVEIGEREVELFPELLGRPCWLAVLLEDFVAGFEHGTEVIDESAGPIEDDVADFGHG